MTDDELKRLLETNSENSRRHFDVSVERLQNKVLLVAEAVVRLDRKLDQKLAELNDGVDRGIAETQQ